MPNKKNAPEESSATMRTARSTMQGSKKTQLHPNLEERGKQDGIGKTITLERNPA